MCSEFEDFTQQLSDLNISCESSDAFNMHSFTQSLSNLNISFGSSAAFDSDELNKNWHEKFYNCIRSENAQRLEEEFQGMSNNNLSEDLDQALAVAYEELRLKNVPICEEMQIYVENKLVNLRFYHKKGEHVKIDLQYVKDRIGLVYEIVKLLEDEYSNASIVDEKFLFLIRFIAINLHVLKRLIKCTYDRLPWEEMEFLLVYFYGKHLQLNPIYCFPLRVQTLLKFLSLFNEKLKKEENTLKDNDVGSTLPKQKRRNVVEKLISCNSNFHDFYTAYKQIKDINSLTIITTYLKLTEYECCTLQQNLNNIRMETEVDLQNLILERALLVTGEYLKNTFESPHMSDEVSKLLQSQFNGNVMEVMVSLRNSLAHVYFTESGNREKMCSFIGVDKARQLELDLSNFRGKINEILTDKKVEQVRSILEKITNSENLEQIHELSSYFTDLDLEKTSGVCTNVRALSEVKKSIEKLEDFIKEFDIYVNVKHLFFVALGFLSSVEVTFLHIEMASLQFQLKSLVANIKHSANIANIKAKAADILEIFNKDKEEFKPDLNYVYCIVKDIHNVIQPFLTEHDFKMATTLVYNVFYYAEVKSGRINDVELFMEELRIKVEDKQIQTEIQSIFNHIKTNVDESTYQRLESKKNALVKLKKLTESQMPLIDESELVSLLSEANIDGTRSLKHFKNWKKCISLLDRPLTHYFRFVAKIKNFLKTGEFKLLAESFEKCFLPKENEPIKDLLEKYSNKQEQKFQKILDGKFMILEKLLLSDDLDTDVVEVIQKRKKNVLINIGFEKLLLDISSYLEEKLGFIEKKEYGGAAAFLDKYTPTLLGRQLRNHLAHGNALVTVLDPDPSGALVANAIKLVKEYKEGTFKKSDKEDCLKDLIVGQHLVSFPYLRQRYQNSMTILNDRKKLFFAAEMGAVDDIKNLIKLGTDLNSRDMKEWTALHYAAKGNKVSTTYFFLNKKLSIAVEDIENRTPLDIAAIHGNEEVLKVLLKRTKRNVTSYFGKNGDTLLHYAAGGVRDNERLIKYLTSFDLGKFKKFVNKKNCDGMTALHLSALKGHINMVYKLIANGAKINLKNNLEQTPLHLAVLNNNSDIASILVQSKADVNCKDSKGLTVLHTVANGGYYDIMCSLLEVASIDVVKKDVNGETPLHLAAKFGHSNIVGCLLNHANKKLNKKEFNKFITSQNNAGLEPLHYAVRYNHCNVIAALLERTHLNTKEFVNSITNHGSLTSLHIAAKYNLIEPLKILLKVDGIDISPNSDKNETPLHLASQKGHSEIVSELLKYARKTKHPSELDEFVNARNRGGYTPLLSATEGGHNAVIKVLVKEKRTNLSVTTDEGLTVLHLAAKSGNDTILQSLFATNKISGNRKNLILSKCVENMNALHLAARNGHTDVVHTLLKYVRDNFTSAVFKGFVRATCEKNNAAIFYAAYFGHEHVVAALESEMRGAGYAGNYSPLHIAAEKGFLNVVKVLNTDCINTHTTESGYTPLHLAAQNGFNDIVEYLIEKNANINAVHKLGYTPLQAASKNNRWKVVKTLLSKGAVVESGEPTPLHFAAVKGHKHVVEVLLDNNANVNVKCPKTEATPLHLAAQYGHIDVVHLLLQHCASVDAMDVHGCSPLNCAAANGHKMIARVLLRHGASINLKNNKSQTPLHRAIMSDRETQKQDAEIMCEAKKGKSPKEMAMFLIDNDADVNTTDANKGTPLHAAAEFGYVEVVDVLLQKNAFVDAKDSSGCSPLHLAAANGHKRVAEILLRYGASINIQNNEGWTPFNLTSLIDHQHEAADAQIMEAEKSVSPKEMDNFLIEKGANLNANMVQLFEAAMRSVKLSLTKGANVKTININGKSLLDFERVYNLYTLAKNPIQILSGSLISKTVKATENLFVKIKDLKLNEDEVVADFKKYINEGAIIGATDNNNGYTLLHYAVQSNYGKVVDLLLEKGIDFTRVTINKGNAPLHLAAVKGYVEIVKILLKYAKKLNLTKFQAFINAKTSIEGNTALHLAIQKGHNDVVQILLNNGADRSLIPNKATDTPLPTAQLKIN